MKLRWLFISAVALVALLALPGVALAGHDTDCADTQDISNITTTDVAASPYDGDVEKYIEDKANDAANRTLCFAAGTYTSTTTTTGGYNFNFDAGDLDHTTIRGKDGERVIFGNGAVKIGDASDDLTFYNIWFDATNAPSTVDDGSGTDVSATLFINGDDLVFDRVNITNGFAVNKSCVHTASQSGSGDITTMTEIRYSRIYQCGENGEHDHTFYLGRGTWNIHDNFVYEAASRLVATHPSGSGTITDNVLSQGCARHGKPDSDDTVGDLNSDGTNDDGKPGTACSSNITFGEGVDSLSVNNNIIVNPYWAADDPTDPDDEGTCTTSCPAEDAHQPWNVTAFSYDGALDNELQDNCLYNYYGTGGTGTSTGPDSMRINPNLPSAIDQGSPTTNLAAFPDFDNDISTGWHGSTVDGRNYVLDQGSPLSVDSSCLDNDPDGPVGAS